MPEQAPRPVPEGMSTVTTHLWFNGNCSEALAFYEKAFTSSTIAEVPGPEGKGVMHSMFRVGDSNLMAADAWPGSWEAGPDGGATCGIFLYVEDCDAVFDKAVEAGCEVIAPMADMFWGDRMGKVKDPYGHCWGIASHKFDFSEDEIAQGQGEWSEGAGEG